MLGLYSVLSVALGTVGGGMGRGRCKKWPLPWIAYTESRYIRIALKAQLGQVEDGVGTLHITVWR